MGESGTAGGQFQDGSSAKQRAGAVSYGFFVLRIPNRCKRQFRGGVLRPRIPTKPVLPTSTVFRFPAHSSGFFVPARLSPAGFNPTPCGSEPLRKKNSSELSWEDWLGVSGADVAVVPILRVLVPISCCAGRGRVGVIPPYDTINIPRGKL